MNTVYLERQKKDMAYLWNRLIEKYKEKHPSVSLSELEQIVDDAANRSKKDVCGVMVGFTPEELINLHKIVAMKILWYRLQA